MGLRHSVLALIALSVGSAAPSPALAWIPSFGEPALVHTSENVSMMNISHVRTADAAWHTVYVQRTTSAPQISSLFYVREGQPPQLLASGASLDNRAEICADVTGALHLVYRNVTGSIASLFYRRMPPGGVWEAPTSLADVSGVLVAPSLDVEPGGTRHAVFTVFGGASYELRYRSEGGAIETIGTESGVPAADIGVDPSGIPHCIYSVLDFSTGESLLLERRRIAPGLWSTPDTLLRVPIANSIVDPAIAFDPSGVRHVAYVESVGASGVVRYMRGGEGPLSLAGAPPDTVGLFCGLHVDADGTAAIAYYRTRLDSGVSPLGPEQVVTHRDVTRVDQCNAWTVGLKSYSLSPCTCPPEGILGTLCEIVFGSSRSLSDEMGNMITITCLGDYYCTTYTPVGGSPKVIGKCPWLGGVNDWTIKGIPGTFPSRPSRFVRVEHVSRDWDHEDPDYVYADDWPCPSGAYLDWVHYTYDVCKDLLSVRHFASESGTLLGTEMLHSADVHPPATCNGLYPAFPLAPPCLAPVPPHAASSMADVAMQPAHAFVTIRGVAEGGAIELRAGGVTLPTSTTPGQGASVVAQNVAANINASPDMRSAGVFAATRDSTIELGGASPALVSMRVMDPGIVQPPRPVALATSVRDTVIGLAERVVDVRWVNAFPYDRLTVSRSGAPLADRLPGDTTRVTDEQPWSSDGTYQVVGWWQGIPSDTATSVPTLDARSPIAPQTPKLRAYPNPARAGTSLQFAGVPGQEWRLSVVDVAGRLVRAFRGRAGIDPTTVRWNTNDDRGNPVAGGCYWARLDIEGQRTVTPIIIVR